MKQVLDFLNNYWKALLALVLIIAAAWLYFNVYETERLAYENDLSRINTSITGLQASIQRNMRYESVQHQLEEATAKLDQSRLELYQHFPVEMRQEDQIMYVLYLERIFGTEIQFAFSQAQPIVALRDGAQLMGLTLTVNYQTDYQGFKDMVNYLATDDTYVTSVRYASIQYDAQQDVATGNITLLLYLMDSELLEYLPPELVEDDVGKDNPYKP